MRRMSNSNASNQLLFHLNISAFAIMRIGFRRCPHRLLTQCGAYRHHADTHSVCCSERLLTEDAVLEYISIHFDRKLDAAGCHQGNSRSELHQADNAPQDKATLFDFKLDGLAFLVARSCHILTRFDLTAQNGEDAFFLLGCRWNTKGDDDDN